jgi:hypothetical protein
MILSRTSSLLPRYNLLPVRLPPSWKQEWASLSRVRKVGKGVDSAINTYIRVKSDKCNDA